MRRRRSSRASSAASPDIRGKPAMRPPLPANEGERLAALARFHVLDSAPDAGCDDLLTLAASLCDTPMALVTLVDRALGSTTTRGRLNVFHSPAIRNCN